MSVEEEEQKAYNLAKNFSPSQEKNKPHGHGFVIHHHGPYSPSRNSVLEQSTTVGFKPMVLGFTTY